MVHPANHAPLGRKFMTAGHNFTEMDLSPFTVRGETCREIIEENSLNIHLTYRLTCWLFYDS